MKVLVDGHLEPVRFWRPDPEMDATIPKQFRADRITPLDFCPSHPTPSLAGRGAVVHDFCFDLVIFLCALGDLCGKTFRPLHEQPYR